MLKRKGGYTTLMPQRDLMLLINYLKVIKGYGDLARFISIGKKVEEAALPFSISPDRAKRIISRMLKERALTSDVTVIECTELLEELNSLAVQKNERLEQRVNSLNKILMEVGVTKTHEEVKALVQKHFIYG